MAIKIKAEVPMCVILHYYEIFNVLNIISFTVKIHYQMVVFS